MVQPYSFIAPLLHFRDVWSRKATCSDHSETARTPEKQPQEVPAAQGHATGTAGHLSGGEILYAALTRTIVTICSLGHLLPDLISKLIVLIVLVHENPDAGGLFIAHRMGLLGRFVFASSAGSDE